MKDVYERGEPDLRVHRLVAGGGDLGPPQRDALLSGSTEEATARVQQAGIGLVARRDDEANGRR
jgi:hypothetical protein